MNNSYIEWAITALNSLKYQLEHSSPKIIQDNPWAQVYQFKTTQGLVYLKIIPPSLSIESTLINLLHQEFKANVPIILAENKDQHCFLMQDAGIQLNNYFKENFQPDILINTFLHYIPLQIATLDRIDLFLKLDVPDWRLHQLPKLYQDLMSHETLLIEDGLGKDEIIKLKKLEPAFNSICEKLSHYKIKETFDHADFHDKNILINVKTLQTTLIDLGEVVITHPFFSFLNCLHRAKQNFSLSDDQYQQLQRECFEPWLQLETQEHIFEILALIQQCWPIHGALGELRLINSVDKISFEKLRRQGRLANSLRHWIENRAT